MTKIGGGVLFPRFSLVSCGPGCGLRIVQRPRDTLFLCTRNIRDGYQLIHLFLLHLSFIAPKCLATFIGPNKSLIHC